MKKLLKVGKEVHENYINGLFFKKKKTICEKWAISGPKLLHISTLDPP